MNYFIGQPFTSDDLYCAVWNWVWVSSEYALHPTERLVSASLAKYHRHLARSKVCGPTRPSPIDCGPRPCPHVRVVLPIGKLPHKPCCKTYPTLFGNQPSER